MSKTKERVNDIFDNSQITTSLRSFAEVLGYDFEELAYENKDILRRLQNLQVIFTSGEDAYTNGERIVIGRNFTLFKNQSDEGKYRSGQAVIAHEVGHILYTDFNKFRSFILKAPKRFKKFSNLAKSIYNILEDYRIEQRMARHSKFLARLLFRNRLILIKNRIKDLNEKKGEIQNDEDRVTFALDAMMVTLLKNKYLAVKDDRARKLYRDVVEAAQEGLRIGTNDSIEEASMKIMQLLQKMEFDPFDIEGNYYINVTSLNRTPGSSDPIEGSGGQGYGGTEEGEEDQESQTGGEVGVAGQRASEDFAGVDESRNITEMNHQKTDGSEYEELELDEAVSEINREMEKLRDRLGDVTENIIASYKMSESVEIPESKVEELYDISESPGIQLPDLKLEVIKSDRTFSNYEYNKVVDSLSYEIDHTVRELMRLINAFKYRERRKLKTGKLDSRMIPDFVAKDELKIFKNRRRTRKPVNLNVSLLVDSSGSNGMQVPGTRMPRYILNQMMAVYFHEVLKRIKFKHSAYSFYSSSRECLIPMIDVETCFNAGAGLNLASITARAANTDSFHIKMATERLKREAQKDSNEQGLLIVLSDGMPNSAGYSGTSAMKEVKDSVEEAKQKGIEVFGIFTGSEGENDYFEEMYENHYFLNNESLKDFPKVFGEIISKTYQGYNS